MGSKRKNRSRDYSAEYKQRIRRGHLAGLTRDQARGHQAAKVTERPRITAALRSEIPQEWYDQMEARGFSDVKIRELWNFVKRMTRQGVKPNEAYTLWFSP